MNNVLMHVNSQYIVSSQCSPQIWIVRGSSTCNGSESASKVSVVHMHALFVTLSALVVSSDWLFSRYDYARQCWRWDVIQLFRHGSLKARKVA